MRFPGDSLNLQAVEVLRQLASDREQLQADLARAEREAEAARSDAYATQREGRQSRLIEDLEAAVDTQQRDLSLLMAELRALQLTGGEAELRAGLERLAKQFSGVSYNDPSNKKSKSKKSKRMISQEDPWYYQEKDYDDLDRFYEIDKIYNKRSYANKRLGHLAMKAVEGDLLDPTLY